MKNLITMAGPKDEIDIRDLSNYEAGLAFLGMVNQVYPGIKFGQLQDLAAIHGTETMGRSWWRRAASKVSNTLSPTKAFNSVASVVGDVKDGIGGTLMDTFSAAGGLGGDALRLFTDQSVIEGINSSYSSFTDSGGVFGAVGGSGVSDLFGGGGDGGGLGEYGQGLVDWISSLGNTAKSKAAQSAGAGAAIPGGILPWAVGGVAVLFLATRGRGNGGRR